MSMTILLTPSKRRRDGDCIQPPSLLPLTPTRCIHGPEKIIPLILSPKEDVGQGESSSSVKGSRPRAVTSSSDVEIPHHRKYNTSDLYAWTFRPDAIAACFSRDIYEMRSSGDENFDFYYLGSVPCRVVHIVGLTVGVQHLDYETRYTVDDGTAVIDCVVRHPRPKPKAKSPERARMNNPDWKGKRKVEESETRNVPVYAAVATVGDSVSVRGRISRARYTRCLRVEPGDILPCVSANDEPRHWMRVLELHQSLYSEPEPFVIPLSQPTAPLTPQRDSRLRTIDVNIVTPSTVISSSPASQSESFETRTSPIRLRHPSRLHSTNLTDNTFRTYVKYYMDNAPAYNSNIHSFQEEDTFVTPKPLSQRDLGPPSPTPTRKRGTTRVLLDAGLTSDEDESYHHSQRATGTDIEYGYTLSYLRRVPELSLLAHRIVRAEKRRRVREAQKIVKDSRARSKNSTGLTSTKSSSSQQGDPANRKVKRLFLKVIRDLYADGDIVLWEGPKRPFESSSNQAMGDTSMLWRTQSSHTSHMIDLSKTNDFSFESVASRCSLASSHHDSVKSNLHKEDEGDMSEPDPNEEAYMPVNGKRVAPLVEQAVKVLNMRWRKGKTDPGSRLPPGNHYKDKQSKSQRPTKDTILKYLRGTDSRWRNLPEWAVVDGLESLKADERVFKVGDGHWDLCL